MINFFVIRNISGTNYHINKTFLEIINSNKKVNVFVPNKNIESILKKELNKKFVPIEKYTVNVESNLDKFWLNSNPENYKVIFLYLSTATFKKIDVKKFVSIDSVAIVTGNLLPLITGLNKNLYYIEFLDEIDHAKPKNEEDIQNYLRKWNSKSKLTNEEIDLWVADSIKIAKEKIYIQSPWFNRGFKTRFLSLLAESLSRGIEVKIFYGMGDDERYERTVDTIALIEVELAGMGNFETVEVNSHSAEIIIDSFNLTSSENIGSSTYSEWGEVGTLRKCNYRELNEAIDAMYKMKKN